MQITLDGRAYEVLKGQRKGLYILYPPKSKRRYYLKSFSAAHQRQLIVAAKRQGGTTCALADFKPTLLYLLFFDAKIQGGISSDGTRMVLEQPLELPDTMLPKEAFIEIPVDSETNLRNFLIRIRAKNTSPILINGQWVHVVATTRNVRIREELKWYPDMATCSPCLTRDMFYDFVTGRCYLRSYKLASPTLVSNQVKLILNESKTALIGAITPSVVAFSEPFPLGNKTVFASAVKETSDPPPELSQLIGYTPSLTESTTTKDSAQVVLEDEFFDKSSSTGNQETIKEALEQFKNKQQPKIAILTNRGVGKLLHAMQLDHKKTIAHAPQCLLTEFAKTKTAYHGMLGTCTLIDVADAAVEDARVFGVDGGVMYYIVDGEQRIVGGWNDRGELVVPERPIYLSALQPEAAAQIQQQSVNVRAAAGGNTVKTDDFMQAMRKSWEARWKTRQAKIESTWPKSYSLMNSKEKEGFF